jgi:Ca2+-binding EF-hand superfamily protein
MVQKISRQITDEEALLAFELIDEDHSKSLEFDEICKHYWMINGLKEGDHL